MSSVISSILSLTFGLLWDKLRDHAADKLKDGDLTDERCRNFIARELDSISSRLDGLARKDLLSSISFFKEGVRFLNMAFDKEQEDSEASSRYVRAKKDIDEDFENCKRPSATTCRLKDQEDKYLEQSLHELSRTAEHLDVASKERLACAKTCFCDARRDATRAFNNRTLSTEDKILATKLRVMSRILENLEDPVAAIDACQLYLEELHCLDAIREIFSVHLRGGFKSYFSKTRRLELMASVIIISYVMVKYAVNFAKKKLDVFSWPTIELPKRAFHPLVDGEARVIMNKFEVVPPNVFTFNSLAYQEAIKQDDGRQRVMKEIMAIDSYVEVSTIEREIHFASQQSQELTLTAGHPSHVKEMLAVTMDCENSIFMVTYFKPTPDTLSFVLYACDATGNNVRESSLEFLAAAENNYRASLLGNPGQESLPTRPSSIELTVSKNKVLFLGHHLRIYVLYDSGVLATRDTMMVQWLLFTKKDLF